MKALVITAGHNSSGKTTLTKKLSDDLGISVVEGDDYRRFLRDTVSYFQNLDFTHPNPLAAIASELTHIHRISTCRALLTNDQPVIHCSAMPTKEGRSELKKNLSADIDDVKVIFLYAKLDDATLLERLRERDQNDPDAIGWEKHYVDIKRDMFEEPTEDECDELLIYDQSNYEYVRDRLSHLMTL